MNSHTIAANAQAIPQFLRSAASDKFPHPMAGTAVLGGAPVPSSEPEVQRELSTLHGNLALLEQALDTLRTRLQPVTLARPDAAGNKNSICSPTCGSGIGQSINGAGDRALGAFQAALDLIENLAI